MLRYRTVASAHTFLVAGLGQAYAFAGMKSDAEQILCGLRDKAHAILRFSVRYRADLHRPWRKGYGFRMAEQSCGRAFHLSGVQQMGAEA